MPRVSLIVAMARNRVIGRDGALPWHLPEDLQHFKALTLGKPVVMGRLTHESIGRPLPGRSNIVISRDPDYRAPGCRVAASLAEALELAATEAGSEGEVMVIGGEQIYGAALAVAERIYLTRVEVDAEGDAWFPEWNPEAWRTVSVARHGPSGTGLFFSFEVLARQ